MKCFFAVITLTFLLACTETDDQDLNPSADVVTRDTVKTGIPGEPNSKISIVHLVDSVLQYREWTTWDEKGIKEYRYEWFDSLGREYKQIDSTKFIDKFWKYIVWYDTLRYNITGVETYMTCFRIDYRYDGKTNQIIESEYSFYLPNRITGLSALPEASLKLEYRKGKISKRTVFLPRRGKEYKEENGRFYVIDTDVPTRYAEWDNISKSYFGEAYSYMLEVSKTSLLTALLRDSTAIEDYNSIPF